ncbi:LADA_0H19196g1_1 [Lachancea dasiensis]|uniref:LADA_0H19196g1_1 n=1 Tax=Lachancea dasiensis TaxID=1072105 RepID=A0A1G4K692_9SACH|nr:LADA_0H19196g1_1 [Lachancea dasiensis]
MSSGKVISNILGQLKQSGRIVGSFPAEINANGTTKLEHGLHLTNRILELKSFNPSLTKNDFVGLLPQSRFSAPSIAESTLQFEAFKVRDPRYFQFKDKYQLIFADYKSMRGFAQHTAFSRLDGSRIHLRPCKSHSPEARYSKYVTNLQAAFDSGNSYFQLIKNKSEPKLNEGITMESLRQTAKPIEAQSLLVWNFPSNLAPYQVMDRFWFYDIKHCFKLYWDEATSRTLTFMAFNNKEDCVRFYRNFHGVYLREGDDCKLLVELLC